jgi:hypothetical protein
MTKDLKTEPDALGVRPHPFEGLAWPPWSCNPAPELIEVQFAVAQHPELACKSENRPLIAGSESGHSGY